MVTTTLARVRTPAVSGWLSRLLSARLGFAVSVVAEAESWLLTVSGASASVRFPMHFARFSIGDRGLACATWDSEAEGIRPPLGLPLPAPGAQSLPTPLIEVNQHELRIGYDIPGLVFWALNRIEEHDFRGLDAHDRFPAHASHAWVHGYLDRPIVDEWLVILYGQLKKLIPSANAQPCQAQRIRVSHDVDRPTRYGFTTAPQLLRAMVGDLRRGVSLPRVLLAPHVRRKAEQSLHPQDPDNTFAWLMDQSESRGLQSTFYFQVGGTQNSIDARFRIGAPAILGLLESIISRGHEVGLHPSYDAYLDPTMVRAQRRALEEALSRAGHDLGSIGSRNHYLRWQHPTSLRVLADAGVAHDATLGYADSPGFRSGTCHSYAGFDWTESQPLQIEVRPLILMDVSALAPVYRAQRRAEAALSASLELLERCTAVGGTFTVLWHNSELVTPMQRNFYLSLLDG